jgi:CheY-like chemotaxis protein
VLGLHVAGRTDAVVCVTGAPTRLQRRGAVLIVEDHADLRARMARVIALELGRPVMEAGSVVAALRLVHATPLSLVITDVGMPDADGCELIRRLRDDPRTSAVPVVAMSGRDRRADALQAGALAFLDKPVSISDLADAARRYAARTSGQ